MQRYSRTLSLSHTFLSVSLSLSLCRSMTMPTNSPTIRNSVETRSGYMRSTWFRRRRRGPCARLGTTKDIDSHRGMAWSDGACVLVSVCVCACVGRWRTLFLFISPNGPSFAGSFTPPTTHTPSFGSAICGFRRETVDRRGFFYFIFFIFLRRKGR
uniref:Secreted protein n=1 Tax=Anopheles darlingi TaxID=43151 RepID=A0A2M4D5W5_ANODA